MKKFDVECLVYGVQTSRSVHSVYGCMARDAAEAVKKAQHVFGEMKVMSVKEVA